MLQPSLFVRSALKIGARNFQGIVCVVNVRVYINFDLSGGELTGDTEREDSTVLRDNDIIITTPEKWDAITRKTKDYARLVDLIRLFLVKNHNMSKVDRKIDEVHLLGDDRGAVLEVVITRMKHLSDLRIVAVSATLPNTYDVAHWIGSIRSNGGASLNSYVGAYNRKTQPLR